MDKTLANYTYPLRNGTSKVLGYDAVGPGWRTILEALDAVLGGITENARSNAELPDDNQFRNPENSTDAKVVVLQIKEKFGGLRVYVQPSGMSRRFVEELNGAIRMAENMSFRTCEVCGSTKDVEAACRPKGKLCRALTLCEEHRKEREETGQLKFGNFTV